MACSLRRAGHDVLRWSANDECGLEAEATLSTSRAVSRRRMWQRTKAGIRRGERPRSISRKSALHAPARELHRRAVRKPRPGIAGAQRLHLPEFLQRRWSRDRGPEWRWIARGDAHLQSEREPSLPEQGSFPVQGYQ